MRVHVEALQIPEISADLLQPPDERVTPLAQEQGLKLAEEVPDGYQPGVGIELFFGAYCYWDITTGSVKRSNVRLVATENVFGLVLQGTETTLSASTQLTSVGMMRFSVNQEPSDVFRQLRPFWELQHLDIIDYAPLTTENDDVIWAFADTMLYKNSVYEVRLL
ncbi:hypothetical protein HPB51_019248 [Rhipicephalus microplus]|uniref:Uncharacterized protein n=1 Tax=Rhipicephalus microplus TaxID=6941 RepID=A0A9J6F5D1_RHIMP|nr:hypothetical protein HPB51_019248 [Rhipicephalus microplus]